MTNWVFSPVLTSVPAQEIISNLVQRRTLTTAFYGGSAEDGKPTNNSIVGILTNNRLHRFYGKIFQIGNSFRMYVTGRASAAFAYSDTIHIFSHATRMNLCPRVVRVDKDSYHIWNIFRLY